MTVAILICGLSLNIASCKKDPVTPEPEPEPQTVTRLASLTLNKTVGTLSTVSRAYFSWENGVLTGECDTIAIGPLSQTYKNNMTYENGLLVRVDEEQGRWTYRLHLRRRFDEIVLQPQ